MTPRYYIKKLVSEGISQTEIARKCKLSNGTITKILYSESKLTLDTIKKIAAAYNVPLSYFIEESGTANSTALVKFNPADVIVLSELSADERAAWELIRKLPTDSVKTVTDLMKMILVKA